MADSRRVSLFLAGIAMIAAAGGARSEDLDAKKTGPQLFESSCSACHRGPQGLTKGQSASALVEFLRQHYTTGPGPAGQLAAYLLANPGDPRHPKPTPAAVKPADSVPDKPARRAPSTVEQPEPTRPGPRSTKRHPAAPEPVATQSPEAPADRQASPAPAEPTAPRGRAQRAASPSGRAPEPAPVQPPPGSKPPEPVAAEAAPPGAPATAAPEAPAAGRPPTESGDQSAFSAPTP